MSSQSCPHSKIENFEPPCWRTLIKCPLMVPDCEETMELGEVEAHCKMNHVPLVFPERFVLEDLQFGQAHIVLVIKDHIPYLIYLWLFEGDVRIAPLCLNPCAGVRSVTDICNVKLFSNEDLILNNNYPVIRFDNTLHCPRCTFGSSRNICHPGASQRSRIDRLWELPNDAVAELLRNETFDCHIQLSSSKSMPAADINNNSLFIEVLTCPICRNLMQSKIFLCRKGHSICKDCKDKRPFNEESMPLCHCEDVIGNTRNYALEEMAAKCVDINNNSAFIEILTCTICYYVMQSWIPVCPTGHSTCEDCEDRLPRNEENIPLCPHCQYVIGNTRNFALETIANKYLLKCKNDGCTLVDKVANFGAHEGYCPFKTDTS